MGAKTKKIFVGGLPVSLNETTFYAHFQKYGAIVEAQIMKDRKNSRSRGFGFIRYHSEDSVDEVLKYDHTINGKLVEVKKALPKHALSMNPADENSDGSDEDEEPFPDQDQSDSPAPSPSPSPTPMISIPSSPLKRSASNLLQAEENTNINHSRENNFPFENEQQSSNSPIFPQSFHYQDIFHPIPSSRTMSPKTRSLTPEPISHLSSWGSSPATTKQSTSSDEIVRGRSAPSIERWVPLPPGSPRQMSSSPLPPGSPRQTPSTSSSSPMPKLSSTPSMPSPSPKHSTPSSPISAQSTRSPTKTLNPYAAPKMLSFSDPTFQRKASSPSPWGSHSESPKGGSLSSAIFPNSTIDAKTQFGDSNGAVNSLFSDQPSGEPTGEFGTGGSGHSLFSSPVDTLFSTCYPFQQRDEEVVRLRSFQFQTKK